MVRTCQMTSNRTSNGNTRVSGRHIRLSARKAATRPTLAWVAGVGGSVLFAAFAGLAFFGPMLWASLLAATGCEGYTALLLGAFAGFSLVAAAVTALGCAACGLSDLLPSPERS